MACSCDHGESKAMVAITKGTFGTWKPEESGALLCRAVSTKMRNLDLSLWAEECL